MNDEFEGRVALVTGGSRGIGRAICVRLAEGGAKVAVNYAADEAAADETVKAVEAAGAEAIAVKADVSSEAEVTALAETVARDLGPVDLLACNAGIAIGGAHDVFTYQQWRQQMSVNVDGTFLSVWAVKDGMIERGFGRIVCLASIAGLVSRPHLIGYGTSKAAVISFVRNCAGGFGPDVRINAIAPGLTETDMITDLDPGVRAQMVEATPLKRVARPDEIAELAAFLLSERSSFTTGQTIVASGGRVTLP